ncbi:MAG: hypothetical protein CVV64_15195 [Candidatus Wallbacteria bacterium HGW-Wallbacteria-1]|jgi:hypothetical protein|uniref:Uncharacterized protein n=1 Tax=Candidatus Wallbacteria bacterium HGW-Wallbacteria-1 TaxID=2013854 RepID=A0A2N1PLN1_9BACT|nr:MAG: hypothetical protein CVV64_15195 [Candidatus Wallbacteria bacterium HGW-Wallbacteria-1]
MKRSAGDLVQIRMTLLKAGQRAAAVPADTMECDYMISINGILLDGSASVGDPVTIVTPSGRNVSGLLTDQVPGYHHSFGDTLPELAWIGQGSRKILQESRTIWEEAEKRLHGGGCCKCNCGTVPAAVNGVSADGAEAAAGDHTGSERG